MKGTDKIKCVAYGLAGLAYLVIAIGILSAASSKFETLVLACLIQVYTAVLYNFSLIGEATDANNYAAFVRFRILATSQGVVENEDGLFSDQEELLRETIACSRVRTIINRISHGLVSLYALYKIIASVLA